ncbi:MAG: hypothetical protein M1823_005709 [Watsoniomyces obsoletus]|nr:MAG: hypothetical protein M1823_005709 [Watsoniomyces obsoletus]
MFDALSPTALARARVLLLPVGPITRSRFLHFVERLQAERIIRLGDVTPDARPNRAMFSPLASPGGLILYDFSIALPPPSHLALSPLELFREPLVVIGIADGSEHSTLISRDSTPSGNPDFGTLLESLGDLQEQYSRALVHHVLLFDFVLSTSEVPEGILAVPPKRTSKITAMKTVVCDVTSLFLAELTTYAKSVQALPSVDSPGAVLANKGSNGHLSWNGSQTGRPARRHGPYADSRDGSRSGSPHGASRNQNRASLPDKITGARETPSSRSDSPSRAKTPPPRTSDDAPGTKRPPGEGVAAGSKSSPDGKDPGREKVTVHGFGSGSLSERARNKSKGRIGLMIGQMYLLAGRWEDAVRELVESASTAKANSDHLWHAKALEYVLVGLIMIAWVGLDFQIPSVCYPAADKSSVPSKGGESGRNRNLESPSMTVSHRLVSLQNLVNLLPDLLNMILALYSRASGVAGEALPQLAYSEFLVRYGKLLAVVHNCGGRLDDDALRHLVLNTTLAVKPTIQTAEAKLLPSRVWINSMIFRAMPLASDTELSAVDRVTIYAGMASVLSNLGFRRKRALIMREIVADLIPSLIQARKVGAAEMGVHPAAGLSMLNGTGAEMVGTASSDLGGPDAQSGVEELLSVLCDAYGTVALDHLSQRRKNPPPRSSSEESEPLEDSNDAAVLRILQHALLRSFGNPNLKAHVLRCCINLCEALPDFNGVLRFTSDLLRTAGSGIAPEAGSHDGAATLSREEQIRLATNISRTIAAAKQFGFSDVTADYWDEFLVRGVELLESKPSQQAFLRRKEDLNASKAVAEEPEKTFFIVNPFLKKADPAKVETLLIADEPVEFRVTLQNLFDFEVEIEKLKLDTEGAEFTAVEHSTTIGPYRKQTMIVSGTPKAAGTVKVTGCIVQIKGCREQRFPIFSHAWHLVLDDKTQNGGRPHQRTISESLIPSVAGPKPSYMSLSVIERLPLVNVENASLPQAAMMMLEGEIMTFSITLRNTSTTTPVDLLLFTSEDSTLAPLQAAMRRKDASPADVHELELLVRRHAFKWKKSPKDFRIGCEECSTLEIEVFAKPGLTGGVVQLDYAYLGSPSEGVSDKFYTRQLRLPLTITVNPTVDLVRTDVRPLASDVYGKPRSGIESTRSSVLPVDKTKDRVQSVIDQLPLDDGSSYCLLLLDLRNSWLHPLSIQLNVASSDTLPSDSTSTNRETTPYSTSDIIQPGHTSRFMLPFPRILLSDPHAPIPIIDPANRRQFVVNSSKSSPDAERWSREAFWYRQQILKLVSGSWEEPGTGRSGAIDLRKFRLSRGAVEAIRLSDVEIQMSVWSLEAPNSKIVKQIGPCKYQIPTAAFTTFTTRIVNRTQGPVLPLLRLQSRLRNQSPNLSLEASRRLLWSGALQQPVPLLSPGESTAVALAVCVLARGEYMISASVEEIQKQQYVSEDKENKPAEDGLGPTRSRRIWHAEAPCILIAED